jgi:hypothetical protein
MLAAALRRRREPRSRGSADRLKGAAVTRVTTAFIGALARFEAAFGGWWGHGLPDHGLTPDQRHWRGVWREVRRGVLDNGNDQAKALVNEIESQLGDGNDGR